MGGAAKTLDATNNRLTALPADISSFTNLQRLILASNRLSALPVQISALIALKVGVFATLYDSQVLLFMTVTLERRQLQHMVQRVTTSSDSCN